MNLDIPVWSSINPAAFVLTAAAPVAVFGSTSARSGFWERVLRWELLGGALSL